jgi:hypothetical protein
MSGFSGRESMRPALDGKKSLMTQRRNVQEEETMKLHGKVNPPSLPFRSFLTPFLFFQTIDLQSMDEQPT